MSRAVVLESPDAETLSKLLGGTGNAPAPSHVEASRPGTIVKAQAAKRQLLLVAYPAMKADVGRAADGFRDFAGPDAVEKACHEFAKGGYQLGLWHEKGHEDCGTVLENYVFPSPTSWVVKGPSGDEMEICQGDWLVKVTLPLAKVSLTERDSSVVKRAARRTALRNASRLSVAFLLESLGITS